RAEHAIRYGGDTSPITTSPELHPVPLHRTWNSRMYDVERGIVRFPITSPMNKTRHQQSKRIGDTFPLKFSALRTTLSSQRGSVLPSDSPCIYRTPPVYDIWHQKFVQSDGITHTYNPAYPYDNIPRNLIVYDNAPTPGHRRTFAHVEFTAYTSVSASSPLTSSRSNPARRAPLAMPEELTGSTSTSILSSNVTPERESTASKVCTKIFPSEQLSFSPETTECSGGTITSSCSLPVVSRISTTPPSDTSVYKLYHQNSDDESPSSLVKMRPGWDASTGRVSPMDSNKASESINEIEEWKKIDDILSSFGGAVCRESVFAANYESQVAVFLRDCHSQALTLQLTSQPSTNRHNLNTSSSSTCKSESEQITVSQWLCTTVGIPNPKAAEVGQILTGAGFDRLTQLVSTRD
uniref:UBA domain-containing protein n=1 Tax=Angiostrongylus cantonensis TaxID=6313 RepID=A0A0K0D048_ANGCA